MKTIKSCKENSTKTKISFTIKFTFYTGLIFSKNEEINLFQTLQKYRNFKDVATHKKRTITNHGITLRCKIHRSKLRNNLLPYYLKEHALWEFTQLYSFTAQHIVETPQNKINHNYQKLKHTSTDLIPKTKAISEFF